MMPIIRMHSRDGLLTRAISLKALAIIILIFIPFLLSGITFSQATTVERTNSEEQHVSSNNPVFIAGEFQYFDLTLTVDKEKICIIAYSGDSIPDPYDRSVENYYRWEYNQGTWKDLSGHDSLYIKPSKCSKENNTYFFHIGIDHKANPGHWTIKVIVDEKEVSSTPSLVMISGFTFFLSSIIGVFEPTVRDKKYLVDLDFICSDRKKIMAGSEKNVDILVDEVLSKHNPRSKKEKTVDDILDLSPFNSKLLTQDELVKSTVTTYPRSRLKKVQTNELNSFFINEKGGEDNRFWKNRYAGYEKLLAMIVTIVLLSIVFMPVITSNNTGDPPVITIINVQSYPVVGGKWVVMFNTIGRANLTITAVNGTTWSNTNDDHDLKFLELKCGNKTLNSEWVNNSAFIANYSSNEIGYETSKVLTSGRHTLMFRFGDDVAFANNLASNYWLQTTTSDFNNGTKNNINVSDDAFHLNETYYIRNTTLIDDESFENNWPPTGWSETGNWNREFDEVHSGGYSADFDGQGGGGISGNLVTPAMNCSDANVTAIYVSFWGYEDRADNDEYYLDYYDGSNWDQITRLDDFGSGFWDQYTDTITDSQYFVSNFQIRWRVVGLDNNEHVYVDDVNAILETNESGYVTTGSLISEAHDTGRVMSICTNIIVNSSTPSGTTTTAWVRAADTQANLSTATWYDNVSYVPHKRWFQWRINLTGDEDHTPIVNDVNLTWNYDDDKPTSSVNAIPSYWQGTIPFEITVTASDDTNGSGVKEVALYYNYSADNSSGWSGWTLYGSNDTSSPYSWSFTSPSSDGYYRFYSIAIDNENNVEDPPTPPNYDTICGVDTADPSSEVDNISSYWYNESTNPLTINVSSATDSLSGLKNIIVYYRYREDNGSSWGSWTFFGTDEGTPWSWSFNFPNSAGHYQFYSMAVDNASNQEDPPFSPDNDTRCGYNSTKPSSEVDDISPYWRNSLPLTVTGQATDFSGTGLKNVTLYYYNSSDNSTWSGPWNFGNDTDPWLDISWIFNFSNGTGYYRFYSIAVANSSDVEDFTGNDTRCGYDTTKPSSQVDNISSYWQNPSSNPLAITVTNPTDDLSGVNNISLYYRYRSDNGSAWDSWTFFDIDEIAPWSWFFNFSNSSGHYQFYSIANDTAGNREDPPFSPEYDTHCGYDTAKPSSNIDLITPYWHHESSNPLTITVTNSSDNLSGIKSISLYIRHRANNESSWSSWTSIGADENAPWSWSFNFPYGEGHYQFYSIAVDNASNYEDSPVSPDNDTRCGYVILTTFEVRLWSQSNSVSTGLTLTDSGNADGSGIDTWADADGKWARSPYEYWVFTMEDTSMEGPINDVTLFLKHYQSGWNNDNFKIQLWNGSNWFNVRSYTSGSGPPTVNTIDSWDVMTLGIDTWDEINAAIVRIIGSGGNGPEDTVDWFVDTVEIRVGAQYVIPIINSYDLRNATGSKLNNATGLLDVNDEYCFSINVTDGNGWGDISYINIKAWYDQGSNGTTYNQTAGGNLNMYLQYKNTSGTAVFSMIWPDDEAQLISANCSETIINSTSRIINISFKPRSQVRWGSSNDTWDATQNTTNDPYSWNFDITILDMEGKGTSKMDEYGVYRYTSILPDQDWVDVIAPPGFNDTSNTVTITYSSNYDFNMTLYFEENLTNATWGDTIPIANNVYILGGTDLNDDITYDVVFIGIGEENAVDIFNDSGIFHSDNIGQAVNVQFNVYIPLGTQGGKYTARVATKIIQD